MIHKMIRNKQRQNNLEREFLETPFYKIMNDIIMSSLYYGRYKGIEIYGDSITFNYETYLGCNEYANIYCNIPSSFYNKSKNQIIDYIIETLDDENNLGDEISKEELEDLKD